MSNGFIIGPSGEWGEKTVRRWLERDMGYFVVPTNMIEDGGAPALTAHLKRLVLPDHLAFGNGGGLWVETKMKREPLYYQKLRQFHHGIEERLWVQYLEVEQETKLPGWLAIVQMNPPKLLFQSFNLLSKWVYPHTGSTDPYGGKRMVFFNADDFEWVLSGEDLHRIVSPPPPPLEITRAPRPWDGDHPMGDRQPRLFD